MQLYEIAKDIIAAEEALDQAEEGSDTQKLLIEYLDQLSYDLPDKVEGCVKFIKNLGAHEDALDAEIKRLQEKKKAVQNRIKNMRGYIMLCLGRLQVSKLKTTIATVSISKGREQIEVDDAQVEAWPPEAFEAIVRVKFDVSKTSLKAYEGFTELPGVTVSQGPDVLMIR